MRLNLELLYLNEIASFGRSTEKELSSLQFIMQHNFHAKGHIETRL